MKNSEMRNDYGDLIEAWKLNMIMNRASRMGFRSHELEDIQQELVLELVTFNYDPENKAGASEATILTAIIDNRLISIMRKKFGEAVGRQEYMRRFGADACDSPCLDVGVVEDRQQGLRLDIEQILAGLPPLERKACLAFASGKTTHAVAEELGLPWSQIAKLVGRLRKVFTDAGVAA